MRAHGGINNPELVEAIIPVALALVGVVGTFFPDKNKKIEEVVERIEEEDHIENIVKKQSANINQRVSVERKTNFSDGWNG